MKKTRKVLSFVLAIVFAFSSMPVVYVGTGAADAVTYALDETGTIDNPTKPIVASGSINRTDLYKLNINSQSTSYTFYQTKNDEYFTFGQTQGLQNYYETDIGSRTLTFESISFYEGSSGMDGATDPKEISPGFGMWETPLITNNLTSDFLDKYYVSSQWKSTNSNANEVGSKPENFVLGGAWTDIGGCKIYTWQNDVIFKGNSADVKGEINTGYYEQLFWNWVSSDATQSARFDLRIGTTINVLDARELVKEITEAEDILANADEYTNEYISSVEATLNTIPDDLRDFSKVYSQSEIDRYTQMLKDVSLNSADYTEFNQLYRNLKGINNSKGAYTEDSFNAFKAEIAQINANLPKNLDKTKQSTVDAATQALRDAFDKLVATDLSEDVDDLPDWTSRDKGYGKIEAEIDRISFKFMQTKDLQKFQFDQSFYIRRYGGNNASNFHGLYFEENYPTCGSSICAGDINLTNGTTEFLSRMDQSLLSSVTAKDENGTTVTAREYNKWVWDGSVANAGESIVSNGLLIHGHKIAKDNALSGGEYLAYAADSSPVFYGRPANDYGEIDLTYIYRLGYMYDDAGFLGNKDEFYHWHIPTTIEVTDVRQLISAVADANQTIANPGTHTEQYISAIQAAVDSVPVEMLRGVEYYTQAEVDKLYNDITTIPEDVADYSEFDEVFEWMLAENKDKYTKDSYDAFINEIYAINQNLPKNLKADQQSTIDEAIYALYAAHDKLVSIHLNSDNVITQEDIDGISDIDTNNPLAFTIASTQYNFMQVADGQKFAIRTDLTARNSKARYTCQLLSLRFSAVTADTTGTICEGRETPDIGCHNGDKVTLNQSDVVVNAVEGVNVYSAMNDAGDIAEHNTWVNTEGVALSTNGILNDPTTLSTSDSSAYAEMYYTGPTGNHEAYTGIVDVTFALRLGWEYYEKVLGIDGTHIKRHAHIPVNIKITDARALNSLYEETDAILKGKTDKNYTFDSLVNLYNAFNKVDPDMAYGSEYFTQEQVNAAYEELKADYDELVAGADYSEYFKAYVKAEEIINSGNTDSRGNKRYDEEIYNSFVENVTNIENNLPKNLTDTEENQAIIDEATKNILDAITELEVTKKADYSDLNDAMTEAEKILNATEGTYTDATIEAVQNAYNNAVALDKNLPVSEQAQVDSVTSALEAAIADKEYKADYSEYNEAYNKVQDIIDNPDKYTEEIVKAAEDVMNTAGAIDKDLADTAENRIIIKEATDALNNVLAGVEEKADYSGLDEAIKNAEEIVNNPDKYTEETVKNAQDALDAAENLDKDLEKNDENQAIIDDVIQDLIDSVTNAKEKADYTDYNTAKTEADNLVNDDGNGNSVYDEEAFQQYKDKVTEIDNNLDKNLPKTEENQKTVDDAAQALKDLRTELDATKGSEKDVIEPETTVDEIVDEVINDITQNQGYTKDEIIVEFKDYTGKELESEMFVGTGSTMRVILKSTGELLEYKLFIVMGDVDGNGQVNAADYNKSMNVALEEETYAEENYYFLIANDIDEDGVIDVLDTFEIRRMYK